jgi:hypothetical protein
LSINAAIDELLEPSVESAPAVPEAIETVSKALGGVGEITVEVRLQG